MLTQLSTVKARLAIDALDVQYDALLTTAIDAVSLRFAQNTRWGPMVWHASSY